MKYQHLMWNIGLSDLDAARISEFAGSGYTMQSVPADALPSPDDLEREAPCIIWVAASAQEALAAHPRQLRQHLELVPRALVLDVSYTQHDLEQALDLDFSEIVRRPISRKRVLTVLRRAVETRNVHQDILRMTKEILLERELLARKNDLLSFVVTFLTRTTESLDISDILINAREGFGKLLPVTGLHAIIWPPSPTEGAHDAELFIGAHRQTEPHAAWTRLLLESAHRLARHDVAEYRTTALTHGEPSPLPEAGRVMMLPLGNGGNTFGAIAIALADTPALGKDQAQALDSVMRHLTLALRNAVVYREIKLQADHDALTQLHNRRSFDHRLAEEVERHLRYDMPMTLLMLDIDHFKAVNDTYGHPAGDAVLREVALAMRGACRTTDFAARYGGEEFCVILPHTDGKRGHILAERLRKRIAASRVDVEGKTLSVTVSIGLATLSTASPLTPEKIVCEADSALYAAKAAGRNIVCEAQEPCERAKALRA